ncbi:MAG: hypothetical protein JNM09_22695, partial [Blastocatellia bacterium]|nr:hypothetical protein [Blastocatellia bacterium]
QLEKILAGQTLHSSENLRAFLRFVAMKVIENDDVQIKEFVIATEVFGRGDDFDSRIDSVVRVQAGRLRTKLHEYYASEGKEDQVIIDLPKGQYTPIFTYTQPLKQGKIVGENPVSGSEAIGGNEAPLHSDARGVVIPGIEPRPSNLRWLKVALTSLVILCCVLGVMTVTWWWKATLRAETIAAAEVDGLPSEIVTPLWGDLLRSPEPILVVYSNTLFQGSPEEGMKVFKSYGSPGGSSGSPALERNLGSGSPPSIIDHYTGIGEVMGVYSLADFFSKVHHPFRVKRSLLLTWDDTKTQDIVVLGSPAENLFLRDLPQKQDFVFRVVRDEQQKETFGLINSAPRTGEQPYYLAKQEGPSRSQISEDFAVISLLQGLSQKNKLLILAGITTYGTQAAAEYVSRPETIKDLISHLNLAPSGQPPKLPPYFQVLIRVKINGGVPVQTFYVTHHVLSP